MLGTEVSMSKKEQELEWDGEWITPTAKIIYWKNWNIRKLEMSCKAKRSHKNSLDAHSWVRRWWRGKQGQESAPLSLYH